MARGVKKAAPKGAAKVKRITNNSPSRRVVPHVSAFIPPFGGYVDVNIESADQLKRIETDIAKLNELAGAEVLVIGDVPDEAQEPVAKSGGAATQPADQNPQAGDDNGSSGDNPGGGDTSGGASGAGNE